MLHPTFRRCVFWAHLATGLTAGLVIFLLAATGLLMSFETQIINRAERSIVRDKANGDATPLTPAEMVAAFEKSGVKGRPMSLNYSSDPEAPVIFLVGKGNQQLFHPTTGEYLGKGAAGTRKFFQTVLSLHRWLTLPMEQRKEGEKPAKAAKSPQWKDIGGQITAAATLVFVFLLITGLIIWIPKKRVWSAFKAVLTFNFRLKGRAREWNWHNVSGIWASPFILVICLTGLIMAYPWANKLLFASFGEKPAKRQEMRGEQRAADRPPAPMPPLDAMLAFAKQQVPGWESISLEISPKPRQPLIVSITDAGRGRPDRREKFTLDSETLAVTKHETFSSLTNGTRTRQIVRYLHTGEFGGLVGQAIAAFTCAAVVVLCWTGFALSFRRFFMSRRKKAAAIP